MKKFISLALAASMALSLVPVTAFAATDNRVTNIVTVEKDETITSSPKLIITNNKGDLPTTAYEFGLKLDGAEFVDENEDGTVDTVSGSIKNVSVAGSVKLKYMSATSAIVQVGATTYNTDATEAAIEIVLDGIKVTGDVAKITVDPRQSTVSADTFTFAKGTNGATISTIEKTTDFQDGGAIKDIIIEEVVAGSINQTTATDEIKLKLNSGFEFAGDATVSVVSGDTIKATTAKASGRDMTIDVTGGKTTTTPAVIRISGIKINEDGADFGDVAEITVSGDGVTKQTLEVGKLVDFGVKATAEDKDLPTIYSGVAVDDDNNETLKLTLEEAVDNSWLTGRKTTFTFPEGVKVQNITVKDYDKLTGTGLADEAELSALDKIFEVDGNEVTIKAGALTNDTGKSKLELVFDVVTSPDFTGDITCKVGGSALDKETEVTLAKAVAPIKVEAEKTSVAIDYRNVNVGDITVTEAEAGLWEKDNKITLKAENMTFESGIKAEVVEGDGEIKDLNINKSAGTIEITVKSESSKTPMKIKLSNVSLYLDRTLPAGDYKLSLVASNDGTKNIITTDIKDVMFQTYNKEDGNDPTTAGGEQNKFGFDVDSVDVIKDYVTVATAGRDQGTTFTTEVAVTIDSTTMLVDGKEKTLDVPAYLSAEGWTMLPVRAVTEALATSSNSQPIDWIAGNPGTIMIYYGDKTVAMTLGSTTMYINGTPVPMSTAPVIVNDRAFLPMRDLGRALGLSDDQIKWDATTRTATFNPATTTTK